MVATPLTDGGFHEALGLQVSLLAREGIHHAELRLNPADMGPVSVQITMNGDQARVDFGADLAQTRQVIEAGWAELATSLQEAGFTLSGGGVSEHARNRQEPAVMSPQGADRRATADDAPVVAGVAVRPRAGAALDLYA
jgi:flagellar hook-length control protein FliK